MCEYAEMSPHNFVSNLLIHSRAKNKGIGVEVAHFLGDGLYLADEIR
jgi:predicted ribosome-associated RNA-binding protein Tma20